MAFPSQKYTSFILNRGTNYERFPSLKGTNVRHLLTLLTYLCETTVFFLKEHQPHCAWPGLNSALVRQYKTRGSAFSNKYDGMKIQLVFQTPFEATRIQFGFALMYRGFLLCMFLLLYLCFNPFSEYVLRMTRLTQKFRVC